MLIASFSVGPTTVEYIQESVGSVRVAFFKSLSTPIYGLDSDRGELILQYGHSGFSIVLKAPRQGEKLAGSLNWLKNYTTVSPAEAAAAYRRALQLVTK